MYLDCGTSAKVKQIVMCMDESRNRFEESY